MEGFLVRWLVTSVAVLVASQVVPGIRCDTLFALLVASLVLGLFNAILKPILMLVSLPILIFTFGLFTLIINSLMLYWVSFLVKGFHINSFLSAFWGSLIISIVTMFLRSFQSRNDPPTRQNRGPKKYNGTDKVIDV